MAVVLTLICAVAGFGIAWVDSITRGTIETAGLAKVAGAIDLVLPDKDNDPIKERINVPMEPDHRGRPQALKVFPAKKQGKVVAVALQTTASGYAGPISLVVGINPADMSLTGIFIAEQQETIAAAQKALDPSTPEGKKFVGQFAGKSVKKAMGKGDIDAVSGATYSTLGVLAAVNKARGLFEKYRSQIMK